MHVEFVLSAFSERELPRAEEPEVVFAGRSNCGKSSLINKLVGRKNLARTSATPGKTQSINFYRVDSSWLLVDLPGYGYSAAGQTAARRWRKLIEHYFEHGRRIALVVHLVDARRPPTAQDLQLAEWLERLDIPRMIVATKADKLSGNEKRNQQKEISFAFAGATVLLTSAATGDGCRDVWKTITEALAAL